MVALTFTPLAEVAEHMARCTRYTSAPQSKASVSCAYESMLSESLNIKHGVPFILWNLSSD